MNEYVIALAGNPNVGKSTIFNSFTGLHQHTGNWTGKTVENAKGEYVYHGTRYTILDLPGTYSLSPQSAEERAACDYIKCGDYDVLIIVVDAVCIERNLRFAVSLISEANSPVILCVNLIDEASKKGIYIDFAKMSAMLCVPVIPAAARSGEGLHELKSAVERAVKSKPETKVLKNDPEELARRVFITCCTVAPKSDSFDRRTDRVILSKVFGIPLMILLLLGVFWITIIGANYPSELLSGAFSKLGEILRSALLCVHCPEIVISMLIDGVYGTLSWVIAVMLPPMAIFFPLFTLLEDAGYLPRVAFNLDTCFSCAGAHGKQSLTTAMAFGCNACAVTGCRIIDSPRERMIAMMTNSLIPCNGRFPMIITLIMIFLCRGSGSSLLRAAVLLLFIVISVTVSLIVSKILSKTILRGHRSSFVLELPPYRRPQIGKVIVRSVFDRTVFVLLRAVAVAAPAGLLIWVLANVKAGGIPLLLYLTEFLDPIGIMLGMDGAILAAFILGFPANEIVLPITVMIYMSQSIMTELPDASALGGILSANGWTAVTAVCVILFSMFHFPCSTTVLTVYKETKSIRYTAACMAVPLIAGIVSCLIVRLFTLLMNIA